MHTHARRAIPVIGILVFAFFCCAPIAYLATLEAVYHMRSRREPVQPTVAPEELLLPVRTLPSGWRVDGTMSDHPLTELFRKAAIVVAHTYRPRLLYEGSWVAHTVAWYRTEAGGHRDYADRKDPVFSKWAPWEELSAWAYTSPYADEQNLVCIQENVSGTIVGYQCFFIARYGQHLSVLNIRLVAERANPDQVKEWIVTVDELFADVE